MVLDQVLAFPQAFAWVLEQPSREVLGDVTLIGPDLYGHGHAGREVHDLVPCRTVGRSIFTRKE